jgi:hypothetical protein
MAAMQTVSCGACGANLDLQKEERGRVQCDFCSAWSVFTATGHEPVALGRYAAFPVSDAIALVTDRLRRRALPEARGLETSTVDAVYRMREVSIEQGAQQIVFLSNRPWYADLGRHRVGSKLEGAGPDLLRMGPDVERLPWSEPEQPAPEPPDSAQHADEGFSDRIELELRRRQHQDAFFLMWSGPVEVVRVPFVEVSFALTLDRTRFVGEPDADTRWWVRIGPDGSVVDERLPRRKLQLPSVGKWLVVGTLAVVGLVAVLAVGIGALGVGLPCLLGVLGSL